MHNVKLICGALFDLACLSVFCAAVAIWALALH